MLAPTTACLVGLGLASVAALFALAAGFFRGEAITMGGIYDWVRGRWPYVIAVATPFVVGAHEASYLTDRQFAILAALGTGGGIAALRGALKAIVADAIARKVTVQVREARVPVEDRPPVVLRESVTYPPRRPSAPSPYEDDDPS